MKKQRALKALEKLGHRHDATDLNTITGLGFYSFFYIVDPSLLRRRYMFVIGGWMLSGCFAIAMTGILILLTYLDGAHDNDTLRNWFFGGIALSVVFSVAQIQVLYGHRHWIWVNVGIYIALLLVSLPTINYQPNTYLYATALLSPLIGLLILNSNRCREMRHTMVEIRQKRQDIIATLKKQGRWKWWTAGK
ncbi:hypothetical protein [Pseudomonas antarctica]|uniref:hypothetical protein n=1 Tax=Pseudomonas antarctica TaxID=219572 RepID=UPI003F74BFB4